MSNNKKCNSLIAFDIEATGQNMATNVLVAVGWSDKNGNGGSVSINLRKPSNKTWYQFWRMKGWEERCYKEFWIKNLDVLDSLQIQTRKHAVVNNEKEMADYIQKNVSNMEWRKETNYVFDTLGFDAAWLTALMTKHNYPSMVYMRDGNYTSNYEIDSYIMGLCRSDVNSWQKTSDFKKEICKSQGLLQKKR